MMGKESKKANVIIQKLVTKSYVITRGTGSDSATIFHRQPELSHSQCLRSPGLMNRQERRRGHARPSRGPSSGGSRSKDRTSEIYNELLEEALRHSPAQTSRPLKRRRSQRGEVIVLDDTSSGVEEIAPRKGKEVITIETSSNEVSEDEDEMEWDTVDLNNAPLSEDVTETHTSPIVHEITLTAPTPSKATYISSLPSLIM